MKGKEAIRKCIIKRHPLLEEREITSEVFLKEGLGLDSLDVIELVMDLEISLNICIIDSDVETFIQVKDLESYLENYPVRPYVT